MGPTNYLVYEGLNRYGEDEVALTFAEKSYDLFMADWHANQHTNEQYYAWGGSAGGDKHYTWGALLCLIPTEQYIDETPWDGLRFGSLNPPEKGELSNVILEPSSLRYCDRTGQHCDDAGPGCSL